MGKRGWTALVVSAFALAAFAVGWLVTSKVSEDSTASTEATESTGAIMSTEVTVPTVESESTEAGTTSTQAIKSTESTEATASTVLPRPLGSLRTFEEFVTECDSDASIGLRPSDFLSGNLPSGKDDLNGDGVDDVQLAWVCGVPEVVILAEGSYVLRTAADTSEPTTTVPDTTAGDPAPADSGGGIEPVAVAALSAGAVVVGALGTPVVTAWSSRRWGKDAREKSDAADDE